MIFFLAEYILRHNENNFKECFKFLKPKYFDPILMGLFVENSKNGTEIISWKKT